MSGIFLRVGRALQPLPVSLAALLLTATAFAATVTLPTNLQVVGSSTSIDVVIDDATGIEGADLEIEYDSSVVQIPGTVTTSVLSTSCMPVANTTTAGQARIALACQSTLSGGGVLMGVAVQPAAPGTSALSLTRCSLNEGSIPCTPVNGNAIVPPPTQTVTQTPSVTRTATATSTATGTATATGTGTRTATQTATATQTRTVTVTRTATSTRTPVPTLTPTLPPNVVLNPIASPVVPGTSATFTGSGFTAGSRITGLVGTSSGNVSVGPFTPRSWSPTQLVWDVPASLPLGQGFAIFAVVNTDQGYIGSQYQQALLYGSAALNRPTILTINGGSLHPPDGALPVVYVSTPIYPGTEATIGGTGFNNPGVNFFTSVGNLGPLFPKPGATATQIKLDLPANAPLGLGAFEVINNPYSGNVGSQTVFVPIGDPPTITTVSQSGTTITVTGTGFANGAVVNFFNKQANGSVVNLGGPGLVATVQSAAHLTFAVPSGAVAGPSYVQIVNPPFIAFTSSGNDPDGGFTLQ